MTDTSDDDSVTEEEAVVQTSSGERYESLTASKSGDSDDE